jgi:Plexin cytoplasmic RasGAP domain
MIINGDLDSAGMHHHHHHMMHQPNAPHLISPHQQMAPPLPPPISHPPPSTLPNSYHNHHSHHHHMPATQHHHHPQAHQYRVYHLVKPQADDFCLNSTMKPSSAQTSHNHHQAACNERTHKAIPEIFLTRLLATKVSGFMILRMECWFNVFEFIPGHPTKVCRRLFHDNTDRE